MSLTEKVVSGVSWSVASRVISQGLKFGFLVALARLLGPGVFGIFGMLIVFTGFAQVLADGGLNEALVQNQQTTDRHYSTVFWLQLAIGASLSLIFFFGSSLIADFYSTPILGSLTRLASCIFLIQAAGNVHSAICLKQFQFRKLTIINVMATFVSGLIAVNLALRDYGVWALAWQSVAFAGTTTGLLWIQCKWRPRLFIDREAAARLGRYGIYLLGHGTFNYWLRNLDNLLIGKFLGGRQLGIYAQAYQLMTLPNHNIGGVIGQVMFPALAQIQNDLPRFKDAYFRATCMIAIISFPLMTGMAVLSEPLVLALFGDKWTEAIPIIRVFSFIGLFQSIVFPVHWIFGTLGKTKEEFQLTIFVTPIFIVAIVIGLQYGIFGVACAYAVWALLEGMLSLHIALQYVNLTVSDIFMGVARIAVVTGIMGIGVLALDSTLFSTWPLAVRLVAGVSAGMSCYLALFLLIKDQTFTELTRLIFIILRSVRYPGKAR